MAAISARAIQFCRWREFLIRHWSLRFSLVDIDVRNTGGLREIHMSMRTIAPVTNVATDSFRIRVPLWGARKLPLGSVHADPPRSSP